MKPMPPEYHGREQTYLKHRVLSEYLRSWVQKLGSLARKHPVRLHYVDCFAGPWRSENQDREDTSAAIGLKALGEALATWGGGEPSNLRATALFVEKDAAARRQLDDYVRGHAPPSVNVEVFDGTFAERADDLHSRIGQEPAFLFVDPTGWKGVAMNAIGRLANGPRRDVMINVMYDHLNRFKDDEREFLRAQMREFFGLSDHDLPHGLSEDELMETYRARLQQEAQRAFVADLAVPHPLKDRTYFRLVLGAGHSAAVDLFRTVESHVCGSTAAEVRDAARKKRDHDKRGQTSLDLDAPPIDVRHAQRRDRDLTDVRRSFVAALNAAGPRRFGDLWPLLLCAHHITCPI